MSDLFKMNENVWEEEMLPEKSPELGDLIESEENVEEVIAESLLDDSYQMTPIIRLDRSVGKKVLTTGIKRCDLRPMVDLFYQFQKTRIAIGNKIYAIEKGLDIPDIESASLEIFRVMYNNHIIQETDLKNVFTKYCKTTKTGRWLSEVKGIGPLLSVIFQSYFDVTGKKSAGQFHSFCGLNDNNKPWYRNDTMVNDLIDPIMNGRKEITEEDIFYIAEASGRSASSIEHLCCEKQYNKDSKMMELKLDDNGNPIKSVSALKTNIKIIPYSKFLKTTCYKAGESFVKVRNRGSLYGEVYFNRKSIETMKNERGEYAEQAKRALETKNWSNGDAKKTYEEGKLPAGHIESRAKRYAVKLFISHLFEQMWIEKNGTQPPKPYILEYSKEFDHNGYIEPEVPYIW